MPSEHEHEDGQTHHTHHTHNEHHKFEASNLILKDSRKKVLNAQKEKRKYKFNSVEYRISRKVMIEKVSKILNQSITDFMNRILADDEHCHDSNHIHEDVRESSMLFKENNYDKTKWTVEIPISGYANILPFFSFLSTVQTQSEKELATPPKTIEIERFIFKIMNSMRLSNEVCLMSLIFIERLLKTGGVQLLTVNWRPIIYAAMLIATKYWEDY